MDNIQKTNQASFLYNCNKNLHGDECEKWLKDNTTVEGSLTLIDPTITSLPKGLAVKGDLSIKGGNICRLPDDIKVNGTLFLRDTLIDEIPDSLSSLRSLIVDNSPIRKLPENLSVARGCHLYDTCLTSLPEGFRCKELRLNGNEHLTRLPDNLSVTYLSILNCGLKELPKGLKVQKDLYVSRTTSLGYIPTYRLVEALPYPIPYLLRFHLIL